MKDNEADLDLQILENLQNYFRNNTEQNINWMDACTGFQIEIWAQLEFGLLNKANHLVDQTIRNTVEAVKDNHFEEKVGNS
jgi:hypothetical protein